MPTLAETRTSIFEGQDRELYLHLGYFQTWFIQVEMHITFLMAAVLGFGQLGSFELLVRGMDARVKCERFRKACKRHKPLGPLFAARLKMFEEELIPFRNKLIHRLINRHDDHDIFYLSTADSLPYREIGNMEPVPGANAPESVSGIEFFSRGLWLHWLSEDIRKSIPLWSVAARATLELTDPATPVHMPIPADRHPSASHAKPDTPVQEPPEVQG